VILLLAAALAAPAGAVEASDPAVLAGAAAVGTGVFFLDQPTRDWLKDTDAWFGADHTFFELMGSYGAVATPAVFYGAGAALHSDVTKKAGIVGYEALAAQEIVQGFLKVATGRTRPNQDLGPGHWRFFGGTSGGRQSFPSGHTAAAFSVASVVSEAYDNWWVSPASYGLAAGVGAGRIVSDHHWLSDVLFGAGIGWGAGKLAWKWETKKGWMRKLYTDGRGLYFTSRY
jgi:membrane-associated phospholipid phosphatase